MLFGRSVRADAPSAVLRDRVCACMLVLTTSSGYTEVVAIIPATPALDASMSCSMLAAQ